MTASPALPSRPCLQRSEAAVQTSRCGASYFNVGQGFTFVFPDATILECIQDVTLRQRMSVMSMEICLTGHMQECSEVKTLLCTLHCLTCLPVLCSSALTGLQSKQCIIMGHSYTAGLRLSSLLALIVETQSDQQTWHKARGVSLLQIHALAKTENWKRCPSCRYFVERLEVQPLSFHCVAFGCCHYCANALTEQVQAIVQYILLPLGRFYLCKLLLPCLHQMCLS